jgi:2-hydroxychromene-2-carboxylate isomerase
MMTDAIEYFFTSISPFTWLGQKRLVEIAARHGKQIHYRPFNMMQVWEVSDAVPPAKRSPTRQRYRLVELQRVAHMRGHNINLHPANFPVDPTLADHCIIAIGEQGGDCGPFLFSIGEAIWSHDRNIADRKVLVELLEANGHDSAIILDRAQKDEAAQIRVKNTEAAIAADAIGAPTYVYAGETFWGQDRLEYLDEMIASGRAAFAAS